MTQKTSKGVIGGLGEIVSSACGLVKNTGKAYGKLLKTCYWDIPKAGVQIYDAWKDGKEYEPSLEDLEKDYGKDINAREIYEFIQEEKEKRKDWEWKWMERWMQSDLYEKQMENLEWLIKFNRKQAERAYGYHN